MQKALTSVSTILVEPPEAQPLSKRTTVGLVPVGQFHAIGYAVLDPYSKGRIRATVFFDGSRDSMTYYTAARHGTLKYHLNVRNGEASDVTVELRDY